MSAQHDKVFVVTFAGVLAFLISFAAAIYLIANLIHNRSLGDEIPPEVLTRIDEQTAPTGKVNTDPNAALAAAAQAASSGATALTPAQVVKDVCAACHATGLLGAPKMGDKGAWSARGSLDSLLKNAIAGKGSMPPRGGNPGLSDEQLKGAIQEMTK